jgi:hypothetical protein
MDQLPTTRHAPSSASAAGLYGPVPPPAFSSSNSASSSNDGNMLPWNLASSLGNNPNNNHPNNNSSSTLANETADLTDFSVVADLFPTGAHKIVDCNRPFRVLHGISVCINQT